MREFNLASVGPAFLCSQPVQPVLTKNERKESQIERK